MNDIKQCIGNKLHKVIASIYFEDKHSQSFAPDDIMDICLIFEACSITISTCSDGEAIDIKLGNQLQEVDMNEHGFIGIRDISGMLDSYKEVIVQDINIITNEHGVDFGIELFLGASKMLIYNAGDQLVIVNLDESCWVG